MEIFYREKAFYVGKKKYRKKWLCPLWKIFLLCPGWNTCIEGYFFRVHVHAQVGIYVTPLGLKDTDIWLILISLYRVLGYSRALCTLVCFSLKIWPLHPYCSNFLPYMYMYWKQVNVIWPLRNTTIWSVAYNINMRPRFLKCGACELIFASEGEGGLWTEIFKFWGLRAKIWAKIEVVSEDWRNTQYTTRNSVDKLIINTHHSLCTLIT